MGQGSPIIVINGLVRVEEIALSLRDFTIALPTHGTRQALRQVIDYEEIDTKGLLPLTSAQAQMLQIALERTVFLSDVRVPVDYSQLNVSRPVIANLVLEEIDDVLPPDISHRMLDS